MPEREGTRGESHYDLPLCAVTRTFCHWRHLCSRIPGRRYSAQARNLERFRQRNTASEAFKHTAGERVAALLRSSDPSARRLCGNVYVPVVNSGGQRVDVEVDEIGVSDSCAFVVEVRGACRAHDGKLLERRPVLSMTNLGNRLTWPPCFPHPQ